MVQVNFPGITVHDGAHLGVLAGGASTDNFTAVELLTAETKWSYAASFRIERPEIASGVTDEQPFVLVDLEIVHGEVGISVTEPDLQAFAGREILAGAGPRRTVLVPVGTAGPICIVMFRNASTTPTRAKVHIFGVEARLLSRKERNRIALEQSMTPIQLINYHDYEPNLVFSVVSWGAAGTAWLAAVLNDCPSILCLHAANSYWELFGGAKTLTGLEYLQIVGMLGHATSLAGDIHGVSRYDIPEIKEFFGDQFAAAVLVREPLARLYSALALSERYEPTQRTDTSYLDAMFPSVWRLLPSGGANERVFVHTANLLNAIIDEQAVGPIFRMEDLISRPECLLELVSVLSSGKVNAPEHWAAAATARNAVNQHNRDGRKPFDDWQIKVLREVVHKDAIELYEGLGYDMRWLR